MSRSSRIEYSVKPVFGTNKKAFEKLQVRHTLERKKRCFVFFFSNSKLLNNKQLQDYLRK
jgi:hypothetical protein